MYTHANIHAYICVHVTYTHSIRHTERGVVGGC